jgi:hypothetical protein
MEAHVTTWCFSHRDDDIIGGLAPKNLQQATPEDLMQAIFEDARLPLSMNLSEDPISEIEQIDSTIGLPAPPSGRAK